MTYSLATEFSFIPTAGGNEKEDTPVKFICKYMTVRDRENTKSHVVPVKRDGQLAEVELKLNLIEIFKLCCIRVEGLNVTRDGKTISIESAEQFLSLSGTVFSDMLEECAVYCKSVSGAELKN